VYSAVGLELQGARGRKGSVDWLDSIARAVAMAGRVPVRGWGQRFRHPLRRFLLIVVTPKQTHSHLGQGLQPGYDCPSVLQHKLSDVLNGNVCLRGSVGEGVGGVSLVLPAEHVRWM
jgi:hypothetical protein